MDSIAELVASAQSDDLAERHAAFGELVARFQDMAYGYALGQLGAPTLAEEAAQAAFVLAYERLSQLREPEAFAGWLRSIVHSQCARARRARPMASLDAMGEEADQAPAPAELVEEHERRDRVLDAVQALPEGERSATVLYYIDGYSQSEVATFLGVSTPAVRKRLERARDKLREAMMEMVQNSLQSERPSNDEAFLQRVQLATLFHEVAQFGQLSVLEPMLVDGIEVDAQDATGQTLLHWAARTGHLEAAELLLRSGASVNVRDREGRTPLAVAQEARQTEVVALLREHGGEV